MTAPHTCTVEETVANIKRIEHNSSSGPGPSGKRNGPPMAPAGGSGGNAKAGNINGVNDTTKGSDWVGNRGL